MDWHTFLLDFFPLVDEISAENPVLGSTMQVVALEGMLDNDERAKEKLIALLQLAGDLGYTGPDVVRFLLRSLTERRSSPSRPQARP